MDATKEQINGYLRKEASLYHKANETIWIENTNPFPLQVCVKQANSDDVHLLLQPDNVTLLTPCSSSDEQIQTRLIALQAFRNFKCPTLSNQDPREAIPLQQQPQEQKTEEKQSSSSLETETFIPEPSAIPIPSPTPAPASASASATQIHRGGGGGGRGKFNRQRRACAIVFGSTLGAIAFTVISNWILLPLYLSSSTSPTSL